MATNHLRRSVVAALLGNVLAGTAGTAAALIPSNASPPLIGFLRLSIGAFTLLCIAPFFNGNFRRSLNLFLRIPIWIMALASALFQGLFFIASERAGVAAASLVTLGTVPVAAGLFSWLVLKEKPGWVWFCATALAIAGLTLRSADALKSTDASGLVMACIAGTGVGSYITAAKIEMHRGGNAIEVPGVAFFLGSIMMIPLTWTEMNTISWNMSTLVLGFYLGVVTMGIANAFQILGLQGMPPGPSATLMLADPITATTLGLVVLHEKIDKTGTIGIALVIAGLLWQSLSSQQRTVKPGKHRAI